MSVPELSVIPKFDFTFQNDLDLWHSRYLKLIPELLEKLPTTEHSFHTVATSKVMGRLGNHIWGVMMNMAMSMKYNLNMVMFKETKDYLSKYFKGFDHCQSLEEDYCGFKAFSDHFRDYLDSKIEKFYSEKAGHEVKLSREGIQLRGIFYSFSICRKLLLIFILIWVVWEGIFWSQSLVFTHFQISGSQPFF